MENWDQVPLFGARPEAGACVIRESAYALVADDHGRLAIVRTGQGVFLPGGGLEPGETPEQAIMRECLEECGLFVRLGVRSDLWTTRAVQFVYSESEGTHFEKRSTFMQAFIGAAEDGPDATSPEADHELVWVNLETAARILSPESHRWAVERWRNRVIPG